MAFLFGTQVDEGPKKDETKILEPQKLMGVIANDPKIVELRAIKAELRLVTQEIVGELKSQGFTITHSALQAYLQGNVRGSDIRNWSSRDGKSHVDNLLDEFRKMRARLHERYSQIMSKPMKDTINDWYIQCEIKGNAKEKQLADIIGKHYSTVFKWQSENRLPRSAHQLNLFQERVDSYAKKLKTPREAAIDANAYHAPTDAMELLKRVNPELAAAIKRKGA